MSTLLLVFLFQLILFLFKQLGTSTFNDLLWASYNKLPISSHSASYAKLKQLKGEVIRLKRELQATSAQDQFSKWAKLQRQHDKAVAEYEKISASEKASRATFDTACTVLRYAFIGVLKFVPQFYYGKEPMFWLPAGWVPWAVEFLIACPRAPTGSVSINVWAWACDIVINMVGDAVMASWVLTKGGKAEKMEAQGPQSKGGTKDGAATAAPAGGKKEL